MSLQEAIELNLLCHIRRRDDKIKRLKKALRKHVDWWWESRDGGLVSTFFGCSICAKCYRISHEGECRE